jgi:hypothetical protein
MSYTINAAKDLVEARLAGKLGYATIRAMLEELDTLAIAAADPVSLRVLIDESDASPGLLSVHEIRSWIDRWKQSAALKQGRIAVIAPSMVMYGLNRMAHGFAGKDTDGHLNVFRDRDTAVVWLLA